MSNAWISELGTVAYEPVAQLQRTLRAAREAGEIPDTLLVVEHEPVITTGYRTQPDEIAYALTQPVDVVATERGGKATYHGPGQIVVYPIVDLNDHGQDLRAYVRLLEQCVIDTLATLGITAARQTDYPGVWVADRKIASLGIRVTRWVAFHGLAVNVNCDLTPFTWFTPCGIPDIEMTSVSTELGEYVETEIIKPLLIDRLCTMLQLRGVEKDPAELWAMIDRAPTPEPQVQS